MKRLWRRTRKHSYAGGFKVTPEQRIDAALDSVLKASGSALRHYTMPKTLADMREAMRKVMFDEYIRGLNESISIGMED